MEPFGKSYTSASLYKAMAITLLTMILMKATGGAGFVIVIPLALAAFSTRRADKLFFYILLTVSMLVANGKLVPKGAVFAVSQRGLLVLLGCIMGVQVVGARKSRLMTPLLGIFPYIAFMTLPSFFGWNPMISYLKLCLFTLIFFAYFGAANQVAVMDVRRAVNIRVSVLAVAIVFIVGSVALIPFPAISQLSGEEFKNNPGLTSLFKGMTGQSQALGPVISALAVIILGDLLFSIRRFDKLYVILLLLCPFLIYKTSSRTGMGSFILGIAYVVFLFVRSRGIGFRWKNRVRSIIGLLFVLMIGVAVASPGVRRSARQFILKWDTEDQAELSAENIIATRQGKIDGGIANFKKKPLIGNGFQVSADMAGGGGLKGLVLSAPIEKGVWVTAVLEEGGLIGFLLFGGFLVVATYQLAQRRMYIASGSLFVAMLTNLGEFTFFSMTYVGGFIWAMVFAGACMDALRLKSERQSQQFPPWARC